MIRKTIDLYGHVFAECNTFSQNVRVPNEMRDDACFSYITAGTLSVFSQDKVIEVNNDEGVLLKCGNYVVEGSPSAETFQSVIFHLDREDIKKAFGNRELDFLRANENRKARKSAVKVDANERMKYFVQSFLPFFDQPNLTSEAMLAVKLQELVLLLCDAGNNTLASEIIGALYTEKEIEFEKAIESNLFNNLSIAELAMITHRSESTLKRDFKKYYNESPATYFRNKKLEKALQMVKDNQISITDITYECGFENAAHFSTLFRKKYGISPKKYRLTQIEK